MFDKKLRLIGGGNELIDTCSKINIAIQDNTLKLVIDRDSPDVWFSPIDDEQLESTINYYIILPPITIIRTISPDIKD